MEQLEFSGIDGGKASLVSTFGIAISENRLVVSYKVKYNPAVPFLGIYPKQIKMSLHKRKKNVS